MKATNIIRSERLSLILIFFGGGLMLLIVIPFLWNESSFDISSKVNSEKIGQFGDIVGGVIGSIWALAGVILFYIALTEQRKDFKTNQDALSLQVEALNQQIEEFKFQQKEIEFTRKNYEEQSKLLRTQQFESNFYALLNVYLAIKNNLNSLEDNKDYFKSIYYSIIQDCKEENAIDINHLSLVENYIKAFASNSGHLSHYFKSFYRIIKIVDSHFSLTEEEKIFYAKILRSQLTDYEQLLLFYNSYSIYGEKAQPLILKYNLMKHIPIFKKPKFVAAYNLQNNNNILLFAEWLARFLAKYINEYYEIDLEVDKYEEACEYFKCIVGIYYSDKIDIKIYCEKDLSKNEIFIPENAFSDFILNFVFEKIILLTYLDKNNITLSKYRTETEKHIIFGVEVDSKVNINLSNN